MQSTEEPLSFESIVAHVIKLAILLLGGAFIEAIKHIWVTPFIVNLTIDIGEFSMFILMLGELGEAFRWTRKQWGTGLQRNDANRKAVLRRLSPTKKNLRETYKLPRLIRVVIINIVVVLIGLVLFEILPLAYITIGPRPVTRLELFVILFNALSPLILLVATVLTITIMVLLSTVVFRKRNPQSNEDN